MEYWSTYIRDILTKDKYLKEKLSFVRDCMLDEEEPEIQELCRLREKNKEKPFDKDIEKLIKMTISKTNDPSIYGYFWETIKLPFCSDVRRCLRRCSQKLVNCEVPNIIISSIYLLKLMVSEAGKFNIIVFPDINELGFLFLLSYVLYDLKRKKISYDLSSFSCGEKVGVGHAVVRYLGKWDSSNYKIETANGNQYRSIDCAPIFQRVDQSEELSTSEFFDMEKRHAEYLYQKNKNDIQNFKSHFSSSILYVGSKSKNDQLIEKFTLDNVPLSDKIDIGFVDFSGETKHKGKEAGIAPLIFTNEIQFANKIIEKRQDKKSIGGAIINLNEINLIDQLDDLDTLIRYEIPIVCLADTVNSFDFDLLENRDFNVWRWDASTITEDFYSKLISPKIKNCSLFKQDVSLVPDNELSRAFSLLYKHRKEMEEVSPNMDKLYQMLLSYSSITLRNIVGLTDNEKGTYFTSRFDNALDVLKTEKSFITKEVYNDFCESINLLKKTLKKGYVFPKSIKLKEVLDELASDKSRLYLVCSDKDDINFIRFKIKNEYPKFDIAVVSARQYCKFRNINGKVIVLQWLGASYMRQILYSYKSDCIKILLYECENRWMKSRQKWWDSKINNENNRNIIKKIFFKSEKLSSIKLPALPKPKITYEDNVILNEPDDIEYVLRERKYKNYVSKLPAETDVEAKPVSFAGGDMSFFKKGHNLLVVTKIIQQTGKEWEKKTVEEIHIGDFLVIRDSPKDIIRDIADLILKNSGKGHLRDMASKWKDPLKLEECISGIKSIQERLKSEGCNRNIQTIKTWLDSDIIIPQKREDLEAIAKITEDSVLLEKIEAIFKAGEEVRRAHISAGMILSKTLTEKITNVIKEQNIDPFNMWDPIELKLENIGKVKVYKIIDIGDKWLNVKKTEVNKIISNADIDI